MYAVLLALLETQRHGDTAEMENIRDRLTPNQQAAVLDRLGEELADRLVAEIERDLPGGARGEQR